MRTASFLSALLAASLVCSGAVCQSKHPLQGTDWELVKLQGVAVPAGLTLKFGADRVTGSTGCNQFWAPVDYLEPPAVDIGAPQSKRIFCPGAMSIERAYLASLESIEGVVIEGNTLRMLMHDGEVFLELEMAGGSKRP